MSVVTVLAFYFILWWLTFFAVLPFGVKTQAENGDITLGTVSSAPSHPMIMRKVIATTIVSALILAAIYWVVVVWGLTLDDIPFLPKFDLT